MAVQGYGEYLDNDAEQLVVYVVKTAQFSS